MDIGIGAAVAWVLALVVHLQMLKAKNVALEVKVGEDEIKSKVSAESDHDLANDLALHLNGSKSNKP